MAKVNSRGYLVVRNKTRSRGSSKSSYRNFWIGRKYIIIKLSLPRKYWGKRIALKVEELDKQEDKQ